jgi:hypothetical protein
VLNSTYNKENTDKWNAYWICVFVCVCVFSIWPTYYIMLLSWIITFHKLTKMADQRKKMSHLKDKYVINLTVSMPLLIVNHVHTQFHLTKHFFIITVCEISQALQNMYYNYTELSNSNSTTWYMYFVILKSFHKKHFTFLYEVLKRRPNENQFRSEHAALNKIISVVLHKTVCIYMIHMHIT